MTHAEKHDGIFALHADSKAFPGGIAALARLIGRSPGVLHNKFADSMPNYDVTDHEADALGLAVMEKTGAMGYIEAKCGTFGGIFVPVLDGEAADDDLLEAQLEMMRRFGELAAQFTEARRDGLITRDEVAALRVVGSRVIRSVHGFLKEVESQVREPDTKPMRVVSAGEGR
ncbi:phage regulatory CII family protein [Aromatoleum toluclasticum]|uniref:phage regulatory CII family protein n=1 Tax=Aromatoleum toluclasticum TaxID=92003 RepID=UPI0003812F68|nr:phage regulatory CII family protein [Aromatoleum toluclasticum]